MPRRALFIILLIAGFINGITVAGTHEIASQTTAWFGMGVRPYKSESGETFLHVQRVVPKGPADRAGLRPGDIITAISGDSLRHSDDLDILLLLARHKPGDRVRMRRVRNGVYEDVIVVVGSMPDSARESWKRALDHARQKRIAAEARR